jgi:GNAT superfamily N-acetyltransferase
METIQTRLHRHLRRWLGRWPATTPVDVVGSHRRARPGWDGRVFPLIGVRAPDSAVVSVRPKRAPVVRDFVDGGRRGWDEILSTLPTLLDRPDQRVYSGVFRWCERPADLPDVGTWIDADDPAVPEWLTPFGHEVLIARDPDTGAYLAGVGLKHHDAYGREIAVGTEPAARGQGLARTLVAQAARRVLDEGAVPTYQHDPANIASARVAEAAGFPDRGWRSFGMG